MTDINIDPTTKTITVGTHTIVINHPVFWKWFGIGAAIAGTALAIWIQVGG